MLAGHYLVNQKYVVVVLRTINFIITWLLLFRMVHAFTCAGMLPSQYTHLSEFAGVGVVGHAYIRRGLLFCA